MARTRREKTLADYLVIAISPILIMTLVGSLAYFLLAVGYRGGDELRVRWVMFWYVMGAVLVARIAIEQGRERAYLLGAGLAGVVALFIYRFIPGDATLIAWGLQVVIWWTSSKLTWDCTLIDEDADSSGSGLIEAAGLVGQPQTPLPATGTPNATSTLINDAPATGWRRWLPGGQRSGQRPHAPGLWIVYFSLAALPLFGLGQLLIPAHETDRRAYAFQLLMVYVASALGLLLTTSFLGLRRYLRQRRLQMPTAMAATWVAMGAGLALILLLLALLIPRPQGEYTISQWIDKVDNRVREASRFAVIREGQGQGAGRPVGTPQPDQKPRDPAAAPATDPAGNQAAPQPGQQPGPAGAPQASGTGGHPNPPPGNGPGQSPKGQSSQGSGSQPGQSEGSQPDQKSSNSSSAGQNQAGSQPQTNSRDAKPSSAGRTENPTNQGKNPG
ncbi:MAG: hypothetical protein JSS02_06160, partial [Planctomycetes bacterium]|nr:hypothetical protein [Planctomycetota bacterium]